MYSFFPYRFGYRRTICTRRHAVITPRVKKSGTFPARTVPAFAREASGVQRGPAPAERAPLKTPRVISAGPREPIYDSLRCISLRFEPWSRTSFTKPRRSSRLQESRKGIALFSHVKLAPNAIDAPLEGFVLARRTSIQTWGPVVSKLHRRLGGEPRSPRARAKNLVFSMSPPKHRASSLQVLPSSPSADAPTDSTDTKHDDAATEALVLLAKNKDPKAWTSLYSMYHERIHHHITYMVHNAVLADDLTQEVFTQAMLALEKFENRSRFSTWLFGIANRMVYKHWRKKGRERRAYDRVQKQPKAPDASCPESAHLRQQRSTALKSALATLPDNLREAFIMVDVQQLDANVAAQRLGITKGNLAVRACRARAKIRQHLESEGWLSDKDQSQGGSPTRKVKQS